MPELFDIHVLLVFATLFVPAFTINCSGPDINLDGQLKGILILNKGHLQDCPKDATSIDLSNNEFTTIDVNAFDGFYALKKITLLNNSIRELPVGIFNQAFKFLLQEIRASHNQIKFLNNSLFENNWNLLTVDLTNNNINFIDTNVFHKDLTRLLLVNLSYNEMAYFEPWPYVPQNPPNDGSKVIFDFQHNFISKFTNTMNWTYDLQEPYEFEVYLQFNNLSSLNNDMIFQYTEERGDKSVLTEVLTYELNVTNNPFFCDCHLYELVRDLHASFFLYYRVEEYRYRCSNPSHLQGIDLMHDLDLDQFVCNVTDNCPTNCTCQEQPYISTLVINCSNSNANLHELPRTIPARSSNIKYVSLYLDGNSIIQITKTNYSNIIKNLTVANNYVNYIDGEALKEMVKLEKLDISGNQLKYVPKEIQRLSFDKVKIRGNPLECECNMTWMADWLSLSNGAEDSNIACRFEDETQIIREVTQDGLNCNIEDFIIIFSTVMGIIVAIIVAAIITAKRCPYETKVLIYRFLRIHPRGNEYVVNMYYDAYLCFDGEDIQVRQWIKTIFMKKLEEGGKKKYSFFCPLRDALVGDDYGQDLVERMTKSRRIFIFLSPGFFKDTWRIFESDQAEMEHNSNDEKHPRVVYIIWNEKNEEIKRNLQEEPWKSRLIGKKVLSPDEKFFWSKVRYELPVKPTNKTNRVDTSTADIQTAARNNQNQQNNIQFNDVRPCTARSQRSCEDLQFEEFI